MKIGLYNIDSKLPNLALMKISAYHKFLGNEVEFINPLFCDYDLIYASKIFTDSTYEKYPNMIIGGSGYDTKIKLPEEIDAMFPDYTIYPNYKDSIGFTTRGCIRKCHFCFVPKMEGQIKKYKKIEEIYRGSGNLILFDNNILAMKDKFFEVLDFCKNKNIKVDFNQALDCRLVDYEIADCINANKKFIKPEIRFAFDDLSYKDCVEKTCTLIDARCFWYVYCDEDFESALERLLILKRLGQRTYLMRDRRVRGEQYQKYSVLAHWSNTMGAMNKMDFYDYIGYYKNRNYFKKENTSQGQLF